MAYDKFLFSFSILVTSLGVNLKANCQFGVQCGQRSNFVNSGRSTQEFIYPVPSGMEAASGINPLNQSDISFVGGDFFIPKITDHTGKVWTCQSLRLKPNGDAFRVNSERTLQRIFINNEGVAFAGETWGSPIELSRPKDERILIELGWAYLNRKIQTPRAKLFLKNYFDIGNAKPILDTKLPLEEPIREKTPTRVESFNAQTPPVKVATVPERRLPARTPASLEPLEEVPARRHESVENKKGNRPINFDFRSSLSQSSTEIDVKYRISDLTPANGWTETPEICRLNGECSPRSWTRNLLGVSEKVTDKKTPNFKVKKAKSTDPFEEMPKTQKPVTEVAQNQAFPVRRFTNVDSFNQFMNNEFPKQGTSLKRMIFLFSSPGPNRCGACTNLDSSLGGDSGIDKLAAQNPGVQIVQVDAWAIDPSGQILSKGWGFGGVPSTVVYDFNNGSFKENTALSRKANFDNQGTPTTPGANQDSILTGLKLP